MTKPKKSLLLIFYTWLVVFIGFGLLAGVFPSLDIDLWREYALFIFLGMLAEWLVVSLPYGSLSVGFALVLATFLIYGAEATAWISAAATLLSHGIVNKNNPLRTTFFNSAQYTVSALGAGTLYFLAGGLETDKISAINFLPLVIFVVAYFVINHILVNIYLLPQRRSTSPFAWWAALRWDCYTYLISAPIGTLMSILYFKTGIMGASLLFLPILTLKYLLNLYVNLEIANKELSALYEVAKSLGSSLNMEKTLNLILEETKRVVNYHTGIIYLWQEGEQLLVPAAVKSPYGDQLRNIGFKMGEGVIGKAAQKGQSEIIYDARGDENLRKVPGLTQFLRSLLIIPLKVDNQTLGVIAVGRKEPSAYGPKHMQLLTILGGQAGVSMANSLLYKRIEEMAIKDGLTKLYNHRFFYQRINQELQRARGHKQVFSIILMDVDNFKGFNDTYGHPAGDTALVAVANVIKEHTTSIDIAARYGGEEFAVMLPETGKEKAAKIAEEIRLDIRKLDLEVGESLVNISVSIGVASYPEDAEEVGILVNYADQALYQAKGQGKNRVVLFCKEA